MDQGSNKVNYFILIHRIMCHVPVQCNVQLYNTVDFEFHDFDVQLILILRRDRSKKIIKNKMIDSLDP